MSIITVPEFIISPPTKTVFENESVEICITRSMVVLGRPVTVTAQTGPKIGAANQATGNDNQQHVNSHHIMCHPSIII